MTDMTTSFFYPQWPAPARVRAAISLRSGGVSRSPYHTHNLATHVGDDLEAVNYNRHQLLQALKLQSPPQWLHQVHGVKVSQARSDGLLRTADGCFTDESGLACAVLTADCLPVLLCDREGRQVAAVHAGWRSLAKGIVGRALARFTVPPEEVMAYLGPAIGVDHFEVGVEVAETFFRHALNASHAEAIAAALRPGNRPLHFYADLYALARAALQAQGVTAIYGGQACTYGEPERFYSYRRDGVTGRIASLIWLED